MNISLSGFFLLLLWTITLMSVSCSRVNLPRVSDPVLSQTVEVGAQPSQGMARTRDRLRRAARGCTLPEGLTQESRVNDQVVSEVQAFLSQKGQSEVRIRRAFLRGHKKALRLMAGIIRDPISTVTLLNDVEAALLKEGQTLVQNFLGFQRLDSVQLFPPECLRLLNQVWIREWVRTIDPYARLVSVADRENLFTVIARQRGASLGPTGVRREQKLLKLRGNLDLQDLGALITSEALSVVTLVDVRSAYGFGSSTQEFFNRLGTELPSSRLVIVWDDLTAGLVEIFLKRFIEQNGDRLLVIGDGIAQGLTAGYPSRPEFVNLGQIVLQTGIGNGELGLALVPQLKRSLASRAYPWTQALGGDQSSNPLLTYVPWLALEDLTVEFTQRQSAARPLDIDPTQLELLQQKVQQGLRDQALIQIGELWSHMGHDPQ